MVTVMNAGLTKPFDLACPCVPVCTDLGWIGSPLRWLQEDRTAFSRGKRLIHPASRPRAVQPMIPTAAATTRATAITSSSTAVKNGQRVICLSTPP
jgi:hypothetical protein